MGPEKLGSVLEALQASLAPIDGDVGSIRLGDDVRQLEIPGIVASLLQKTGIIVESLLGQLKEGQLRQANFERMVKQSEHKQKLDQERIGGMELELNGLRQEIEQFSMNPTSFDFYNIIF